MSDLISRQAVLDYPIRLDHYDEEHGNRHFVLGIESVMEYVESLPSAGQNCVLCEYYTEIETDDGIKGKCTRRTRSDLISKEDVKWQIQEWINELHETLDMLDSIPSADRPTVDKEYLIDLIQEAVYDGEACAKLIDLVDRPTGEWIEVTNGRGGHECSECHSYAPSYASGDEHLSDYCPNCGTRMIPYKGGADE